MSDLERYQRQYNDLHVPENEINQLLSRSQVEIESDLALRQIKEARNCTAITVISAVPLAVGIGYGCETDNETLRYALAIFSTPPFLGTSIGGILAVENAGKSLINKLRADYELGLLDL